MQNVFGIFTERSEVGKLMDSFDWQSSPLGEPGNWPQSLKTIVELILHSPTPRFLAWGDQLCLLYNDAYLPILGQKHPAALGRPLQESWPEIWDEIRPFMLRALAGDAVHFENYPLEIRRQGRMEKAWFSFSYTPVHGDNRQIAGVYCELTETTANVLAEQARQEEFVRLTRLFEDAPGFMAVVHGPTHVFELANQSYLEHVGRRDLIGRSVRDVFPELEQQGIFEMLDEAYLTGQRFIAHRRPVILQRTAAAMEQRFVDFIYQPIRDAKGHVSGVLIQGSDVTEHKLAEDRWREAARQAQNARDRLNALLATVPVGIIMADAQGNLLETNPTNAVIWGANTPATKSVDDYSKWKGWWADGSAKHGHPIAPQEWTMARVLRTGHAARDIIEIEPFDQPGRRKTIINTGAPIFDEHGRVAGGVIAQLDITKQVRAQAALRESEAKFRAIADSIPQLVWSNLPNGEHDYYNRRWFEVTGFFDGLNHANQWQSLVHPDDAERVAALWQQSLDTGEPYEAEYRLRHHRSGEYRWSLARAIPIHDEHGVLLRWMGTATDIHEQKLASEELKLTNQRKDEFLAMLAHELRNPLAPISTAAKLLTMSGADDKRIRQASEIIARQVRHMTELVNDLLDVSRVKRGLVSLDKSSVDVKSIIASAVEQARPLIEFRRHRLHTNIGAANAYVEGDRTRLVQVLVNLLANAAKYTPQGGKTAIGLDVHERDIKVCVTDNGNGIEPDLLPHIFDLFTQGQRTPDRSQGGLGLGLALVKSLMALHGGWVEAKSEGPGKGSTFTLYLPALKAHEIVLHENHGQPDAVQMARSLRLMIVDDNLDAAETLGALLEAQGHQVTIFENAAGALKQAAADSPEVCILDIGLPDMDGYALARRLRQQAGTTDTLLIALTGYGQAQDMAQAWAAGFDHHFVKPVDPEQLVHTLAGFANAS